MAHDAKYNSFIDTAAFALRNTQCCFIALDSFSLAVMDAVNYNFNLPNTNEINDGRVKRSGIRSRHK